MSLSPRVQMLVDQIVQELCFPSGMRPISLDIDMDDQGIVQRVEPRLRFSAKKRVDNAPACAQSLTT